MRRIGIVLSSLVSVLPIAIAGCGGSLSRADGGPGTAGAGGTVDAKLPVALMAQLAAARQTWLATKGTCTLYSYERVLDTGFGGTPYTDVQIENDVPTRRRYWEYSQPDGGNGWMLVWDEMGSQVGAHGVDSITFPASTVEQLQTECESVLSGDPAANQQTLIIDGNGVPTTCTNWPVGCYDACRVGFTIQKFVCAPLSDVSGPL